MSSTAKPLMALMSLNMGLETGAGARIHRSQGLREAELREQRGVEGRDLGDRAVLAAQDVELERAPLGVTRAPEVARGRGLAVGARRHEPPFAHAVLAERPLRQR